MIAITALCATVLPKVGPIDVEEKLRKPNFASSALLILASLSGRSVFVETWKPLPPMLLLVNFCTFAVG